MLRLAVIRGVLSGPDTPASLGEDKEFNRTVLQFWMSKILATQLEIQQIPGPSLQAILCGNWDLSHLSFFTEIFGFNAVDEDGLSLLHVAVISGKADVALELLRSAILNGHASMVKTILSVNSQESDYVNSVDHIHEMTPLGWALKEGKLDIVRQLLEHPNMSFKIKASSCTNILHEMSMDTKHHSRFRQLVSLAPTNIINIQDRFGFTPLHHLARNADGETMDAILSIPSVKPDLPGEEGATPLLLAVLLGNLTAVKALAIRRDVDISILWRLGNSSLLEDRSALEYMMRPPNWKRREERGRLKEILDWLRQNFKEVEEALSRLEAVEAELLSP
ncbi:hypothetical protein CPLU01_13470 [Colletotrichum plurivorum]|uniref:Ankyrin repeat protein n=1 Tax=Colletotrichum plurivorum TaxID=2175906 RepID=A0A8H6N2F6_9PEZI|nr:hypothetical protein CPLU01_13470 [Colletotrichum plurivorum]